MSDVFTPSTTIFAYERGSYAVILSAVKATNTPSGTSMPTGSNVYAIAPAVSSDQQPGIYTFQLDVSGTPAAVVTAYGSLDGTNFYSLGALQSSGTYGLVSIVDRKVRFLTAAVTTYGGNGSTDTITIGFAA